MWSPAGYSGGQLDILKIISDHWRFPGIALFYKKSAERSGGQRSQRRRSNGRQSYAAGPTDSEAVGFELPRCADCHSHAPSVSPLSTRSLKIERGGGAIWGWGGVNLHISPLDKGFNSAGCAPYHCLNIQYIDF